MKPFNIPAIDESSKAFNAIIDKYPDKCPFCHRNITPRLYQAFKFNNELQVTLRCPHDKCFNVFIAYYRNSPSNTTFRYERSNYGNFSKKEFSEDIINISQSFVNIYNQAFQSEELSMNYISGIGYRKSLEFLIKDYLIYISPEKEDDIKKKSLGNCIKDDISNPNLKDMAERAVWLGNDETHYTRKWTDKDINDLKMLINVTVHWIEMEMITRNYRESMK